MGNKNNPNRRPANPTPIPTREQRQEAARERVAYWQGLTPTQQLNALDARLGAGVGAIRQRNTLAAKGAV